MFFFKGLVLGFLICAPIGPIGLLCVRQAIVDGRLAGMAAVLGASFVDALYCAVAGFGITYLSASLTTEGTYLRLAGGLLLVLIGLRIFLARTRVRTMETGGNGFVASFMSTFLLMLGNPMPILVFTATLAAVGVHGWKDAYATTAFMVAGVFVGSALWAPILVTAVGHFTHYIRPERLRYANRIAGTLIMGFGVLACLVALWR